MSALVKCWGCWGSGYRVGSTSSVKIVCSWCEGFGLVRVNP